MVARHFCTYAMLLVSITKGTIRGGKKKEEERRGKIFLRGIEWEFEEKKHTFGYGNVHDRFWMLKY